MHPASHRLSIVPPHAETVTACSAMRPASHSLLQRVRQGVLKIEEELGHDDLKQLADLLATSPPIHTLILQGAGIDDRGAGLLACALKTNRGLTALDLSINPIGDAGAAALAEALQVNDVLQSLDLGLTLVRDEGAKRLVQALQINTSLTRLLLALTPVGSELRDAKTRAICRNQILPGQMSSAADALQDLSAWLYPRELTAVIVKQMTLLPPREMEQGLGTIRELHQHQLRHAAGVAPSSAG